MDANEIPDEQLYLGAAALFERVKQIALFTKHSGFREEREWRIVYMSERDDHGKLKAMYHFLNGRRGVEPKLRFRVEPIDGITRTPRKTPGVWACELIRFR